MLQCTGLHCADFVAAKLAQLNTAQGDKSGSDPVHACSDVGKCMQLMSNAGACGVGSRGNRTRDGSLQAGRVADSHEPATLAAKLI
jgi:hypothetical protein